MKSGCKGRKNIWFQFEPFGKSLIFNDLLMYRRFSFSVQGVCAQGY
ncbi:hypothetical protein C943_03987 [Mariniradius saccharolyticus AK6]|uniref:Uncharacterized protein n=1 Tax=Mariniradius saccharolyticus AK6 TaxID=1239962 RepID=M7X9R1_9BACT|nr:hypothetical protein C943_03987 [Mariniradius saccharolyticus AK6]